MLNRYPAWKNVLVVLITALGFLYALPNLYGEDPAVQVSPASGSEVSAGTVQQVEQALDTAKLPYKSAAFAENRVLVRFADTDAQLRALDVVKQSLGAQYTVALNLAPRTPAW